MSAIDSSDEFDDIRPYRDDELPDRIATLVRDPNLIRMACRMQAPRLHRIMPPLVQWIVGALIRQRSRKIGSLDDLQTMLAGYVQRLVRDTTSGFTHSGTEYVPADAPCLFVSNHRDIALDSIFVNYALFLSNRALTQNAVGDNLLQGGLGNELMRINRSFTIVRSAKTARARYRALAKTSRYIRKTLESNESVWIAQRQGRSKDGNDRTDPALVKMLLLAYKDPSMELADWLQQVNLVPVSLSYEIDPCAPLKAHELYVTATEGEYTKEFGEDFRSIAQGIRGFKGRVNVTFGKPVKESIADVEGLTQHLDKEIKSGLVPYETYQEAHRMLGKSSSQAVFKFGRVKQEFERQLEELPAEEKPYLLVQYANQFSPNHGS